MAVTPPVLDTSFTPASIPLGTATTLNFTVTNPAANAVALTGVAFTDTLPAGLTVPAASAGICGGTVTLSGGNTITLSGATIAVSSNCSFGVTVTGATAGQFTNTTGAVTSTNGGIGNTSSAGLNVDAPPTLTTSFNPPTIALNATTALQFIITNPATNPDTLTGVGFTDTLPVGLTVPNANATLCGGGTVTLTNPTSISLVGASIAPGQTCNFSVTVTGTALGNYTNTTGNVTSTNGGNGNTSSANLAVISAPTIAKAFGAATIPLNGSTTLVFSIQNPNVSTALSGLAFVDSLPAGLVVATTPGLSNTCGGNVTATAGSGTIGLSLGTLAANSSCTIQVNITGTSAGVKNNSVQVSFTGGGANTGNASITVVGPPVLTKSFTPPSIPLGTTTSLNFSTTNPNSTVALTGVGFTDILPTGLTVPNASAGVCGGTVTLTAPSTITFSGASIAASSSCNFSVTVTGTAVSSYTNTTGNVTSTNGGTGNIASAGLNVNAPPTLGTSFSPNPIALNSTSALSFTITNPATNPDTLTGIGFTDTLPVGLTVPNASATVCGGTVTLTNPTGISMSGASIAPGTQCFFAVTVTGAALGNYTNTTGAVTSTNGGNGNTSSANLAVISAPTIAKAFGAATIPLNGSTTLVFSIQNPNVSTALSGLAFVDSLPAGLVVATTPGLTNTCGGTATATAGSGTVGLSLGTLAANSSCTIQVNITGTSAGIKNNSVQVSFTGGGANTGNASITVVGPPVIIKSFGAASIPLNGTTSLQFQIQNNNSTVNLTGAAFTDTLPAGLVVATPNGLAGSCGGGTITAVAGSGAISLTGASLAASSSCTFSVNVQGVAAGIQNNTTGQVTSTEGGTGGTASASVKVDAPPSMTTSFNPATIALNATTALQFIITNPATNPDTLTGVGFTDTLPVGLTVPNANATLCGGGTVTLTNPTNITLVGASIAPGQTCNFSVTVTGTALGNFTNTTGNVTSINGGTGNTSSANLTVVSAPTIAKAFGAATIPLNGSTMLVFSIQNPNVSTALSGLAFVDSLPAGLVVASTPGLSNTCGGNVTATAGSGTIGLSLGTLAANSSCTIQVNVTGTSVGVKNNSVQVSFTGGGANTGNASITVVGPPVIIKSFGAASIPLNGTTSLQFQIQNNNSTVNLTGVAFTDTLLAALVVATPNGLAGSCGAGTITATAGSNAISLSGASIAAGASCTFSVNVTGIAAGLQNNTTGNVTSTEGGTGGTASASVKVEAPPTIATSFSPNPIASGTTTALTFTISNPASNLDPLVGVAFTDTLPTGLTVPNASATVCGGTVTLAAPTGISISGATINPGQQCIFAVTVTGVTVGQYTNTTSNVTSTNGGTGNTSSANLTVNIATTTTVTPSLPSPTYGQSETFTATVTSSSGTPTGSVTFTDTVTSTTLASNVALNGSGQASVTTSTLAPGSHTIQATYTPTGSFGASNGSVSTTVNKAVLTVTGNNQSKLYGASLPTLTSTITGFVNGDTQASATTGTPSLTTTATAASPVGAYPITPAQGTLAAANYTFSFANGTLSVTPATLTVTANNQSKLYGASLPTLTATFTGFVNGDTQASATTGSPSLTTTATAASPAGSYPITAAQGTLAAANYTFTFVNGTLSVTSATLTVTANNQSTTYGAPLPTLTATITGFINGDTQASATTGTPSLTTTATSASPAGSYPITPAQGTLAATNYAFTFVNGTLTISKGGTTTTLAFSGGALVATVAANAPAVGVPTGTVQFLNGTSVAGSAPLVGGTAKLSLPAGSYTAVYSGDGNFNGSTSTAALVFNPATSSLSLTSSTNPSALGQSVTFTATVRTTDGPPSAGAPTGTVQFLDGTKLLGTGNVSGGQATYTTSALSGGSHNIVAQYSGDPTWPAGTANYRQTVNAAVTMSVTASPASPVFGQAVTLTVNVGAANVPAGFTAPTGQVDFSLQSPTLFGASTPLGTATLASGAGAVNIGTLPVGTQTITAQYSGDSTWTPASRQVTVTVLGAPTVTAVSLTIASGQLTLTGVVAATTPGSVLPTGGVQFIDTSSNAIVGKATLSSGKGSATVAASAASTVIGRPIVAVYSGDDNFQSSTSSTLPLLTNAAANSSSNFASDEIASIFGIAGLNGDTAGTLPLTTSLNGVTVNIVDSAGTGRLALLYGVFASAGQINFIVPAGTASGLAAVVVTLPGGGTISTVINIAGSAAGIFTANMTGQGPYAGQVIYAHADGSQTVANAATFNAGNNTFTATPINLGTATDQVYLVLYGTGIRHAASLTATLNGVSVPVGYFGAQGSYPGLDQINLGPLPASLAGAGLVNLVIAVDGQVANTVTVSFQ
jgi:hypothetical protein